MNDIISDLAVSPGDIMRAQRDAKRRADEETTARRTERTVIRQGALRVVDGANIQVEGGGDVTVADGGNLRIADGGNVVLDELGSFRVVYQDGRHLAVWVGGVIDITGRMTTGLINQHPDGTSYFQAYRWSDTGTAHLRVGPVDSLVLRNNDEDAALWIEQMNAGGIVIRDSSATPRVWVSHQEVGSGPQCVIQPSGLIQRVNSSAVFKTDIEDVEIDPADVLKLRGRTWRDTNAVEADPESEEWHVGFIAEEVEAAGLDEFVIYDDGEPIGLLYDRLTVALLELARNQEARLTALEERVNAMDGGNDVVESQSRRVHTPRKRPRKRDRRTTRVDPTPPTDDLGKMP